MRERIKACWLAVKMVWRMYDRQHKHRSEDVVFGHIYIQTKWLEEPPEDTAAKVLEKIDVFPDRTEKHTIAIPFDLIMEDHDDGHQDNEGNGHEPA